MGIRDPRVDAYIEKAPEYARPILTHLREVVHAACPDVRETLKWSRPAFEHRGLLCGMSSFKAHSTFGFWKHELVVGRGDPKWKEAWGSFGRLTKVSDLPSKARLAQMVRLAAKLNESGVKAPRAKHPPKRPPTMPPALRAALAKNAKAKTQFDALSPSCRREYMEWIGEAKRDDTRSRRLAEAMSWIAEGKRRNWKYEKR